MGLDPQGPPEYEPHPMHCHRCYIKLVRRLCPCCDNAKPTSPGLGVELAIATLPLAVDEGAGPDPADLAHDFADAEGVAVLDAG